MEFCSHLKRLGFGIETVIDVGVAHGTPALYRSFPDARFFLVEPLEEFRGSLERLKSKLNAEYFIVAAGDEDREIEINVHDDLSGSSMLKQSEGAVLDGRPRRVPMARLESLLPRDLARPSLLKIDTQGSEILVLRGLGRRIDEIDVIIVETTLLPLRRGVPEFADIVSFLEQFDFVVYDILEGHVRWLDKALAQVDLVFAKREGILRKDARFFNDAQLAKYVATYSTSTGRT